MSYHGIIPAQETTCTLNIHVSEIDCSPSRDLDKQVISGSGDTVFDPAALAAGEYTVLTLAYKSPEKISGFQCEIEIPPGHTHIIAVGTKKGEGGDSTVTSTANFFVFNAKNTIFGVVNPEISAAPTTSGNNLPVQTTDTPLCYVVLAKSNFYNDTMCPTAINVKYRACRNIDNSSVSVLSQPTSTWKGTINSSDIDSSSLYQIARLAATKTYHLSLDINNDGNRFLDILDITALANKINNLTWNQSSENIKPEYICRDQADFIVKSDLVTELEIMSANVTSNNDDSSLYDLVVDFGLRSSNTTAGLDFIFGRDICDTFEGTEKIELIGPLQTIKDTWGYKFVSIRNRFNRDVVTRIMAYQMPIDVNNVETQHNFITAQNMLKVNSLGTQEVLTPIIRYTLSGCKLEGGAYPEHKYYYADNLSSDIYDQQEIKTSKQKGERYYGPVSTLNEVYYTGEIYNPNSSRRLVVEWDVFELFNEKVVTNDFLNHLPHDLGSNTNHDLQYAGFNLIYNPDPNKLLTYFDNQLEEYLKYIIQYLYHPINKTLSGINSQYSCEPSGSSDLSLNGYISDADLSGYHDIVDLVSLSNLGTQKLSTVNESILTFLQELSHNESLIHFNSTADSSISTVVETGNAEARSALKSLTKIVPTAILRNFTNTTLPHILPSIRYQGNSANIFFSEVVNVNLDRFLSANSNLPTEFKNWSEYFNDLHDIKYYNIPQRLRYSFVEVKLATNTPDINFITSAEFILDFSNTYTGLSGREFWIYPGNGFPTSSYNFTIRADSNSGSILNSTSSNVPSSGKFHVKVDITGSTTLAAPIAYDGGPLTLAKLFIEAESTTTEIDWLGGKYISFTTNPNTGSIESVGKPLDRSGSIDYLKYTNNDRLVYGPSASYMTLTGSNPDNSASPRHYGDSLLRLRAISPSVFNVEYDTLKPFNTASFNIKAINGIEIKSISPTLYYPAISDYTASLDTGSANDGVSAATIKSELYFSGSQELLRFKTNRQVLPDYILQEEKEFITPPKGDNLDLVIPNIDQTFIFPTTDNLQLHIDSSEPKWVQTIVSGSQNVVKTLANPYTYWNFKQDTAASMPIYTNSSSAFTADMYYLSFADSGSLPSLSGPGVGVNHEIDIQQITFIGIFEPATLSGSFNKIIYKASSSVNTIQIGLRGHEDVASEGSVYITTSGSEGGVHAFDAAFSDVIGNTTDLGAAGHILIVTSDGTDASTSASNVRLNGTLLTSSYSALSSSGVGLLNPSILGGEGATEANYYEGNIGEIMLFNNILSDSQIEIFEGYAAHKWGLTSKLPSNHIYKSIKPDVSNTTINNSATKAAIQAYDNYFPGNAAASNRASSRVLSKYIVLDNVVITSGSTNLTNPDYDLFREVPRSINSSSAGVGDAEIFIGDWNPSTGTLKLRYKSRTKVDGYQIELGNSKSGSAGIMDGVGQLAGIRQINQLETESWTSRQEWTEYIGYSSNASSIYTLDPVIENSPSLIAFGFSDGPVEKTIVEGRDNYNLSSWYLPATSDGESNLLTVLNVDPDSFRGQRPTLESFSLFTNGGAIAPVATWDPTGSDSKVGFDNLSEAIRLAQYGFITDPHNNLEISASAVLYDASGSGIINVGSVLSAWNHLVLSNGEATKDANLKVVPRHCSDYVVNPPGVPTSVTVTAGSCSVASTASLSWTTSSGGPCNGYEIYRRNSGVIDDSSGIYQWSVNATVLDPGTSGEYEHIDTILEVLHPATKTFTDQNPPTNINCCSDDQNPEIEYLVIAFGSGGESVGVSNKIKLPCCNAVPTASSITITSSINKKIAFIAKVKASGAAAPFGNIDPTITAPDVLTFSVFDIGAGTLPELQNENGKFTFIPNKNFIGKTQLTYQVETEKGCSNTANVYFAITPSKFKPTGSLTTPLGGNNTNIQTLLQWNRKDIRGKILKYEIYKAQWGTSYSATPLTTLKGDLQVGEETIRYYDSFAWSTTELVKYKYKVKAFGFSGPAENACEEDRCVSIETDDVIIEVAQRITSSNPAVSGSSSLYFDSNHPEVKLNWPSASATQYYNIYRRFPAKSANYFKLSTLHYTGTDEYIFFDKTLPKPNGISNYGVEDYEVKYRVTSVSNDGENGHPNDDSWVGTTISASISGSANTPVVRDATFFGCAGDIISGDVSKLVHNNQSSTTTFANGVLSGLEFDTSTGIFSYTNTVVGDRNFTYTATSGDKTSPNGTITLTFHDCSDLAVQPGEKEAHIITRVAEIQGQGAKTTPQKPMGETEVGSQTLRGKNRAFAVSKGEIDDD
tara:strand:+ start:366 stop:7187 length:6822 start_codon:yes stop_codon:yes gene_type:complete